MHFFMKIISFCLVQTSLGYLVFLTVASSVYCNGILYSRSELPVLLKILEVLFLLVKPEVRIWPTEESQRSSSPAFCMPWNVSYTCSRRFFLRGQRHVLQNLQCHCSGRQSFGLSLMGVSRVNLARRDWDRSEGRSEYSRTFFWTKHQYCLRFLTCHLHPSPSNYLAAEYSAKRKNDGVLLLVDEEELVGSIWGVYVGDVAV